MNSPDVNPKEYTEKYIIKLTFTNQDDMDKMYDTVILYETELDGPLSAERYREFVEKVVGRSA
jgi:hypothetical protein